MESQLPRRDGGSADRGQRARSSSRRGWKTTRPSCGRSPAARAPPSSACCATSIGDDKFFKILKDFAQQNAWKSVSTEDFEKVAENVSGQDLGYFFIQWIESSGAPEFKLEYTIFRTRRASA